MTISVQAIYQDGILKPAHPLPLEDQEQVRLTVERSILADPTYGMIGWTGDADAFERLIKEADADRREPMS
jgi:predicted DNA-binding antitoxin AbrB/MazE fold protein